MKDILEKLKEKKIISPEDIADLRNYISNKHPNLTSHEASILLVNSIHKVIDNSLQQFNAEYRNKIRQNIINNSVHKNPLLITADEVLFALTDIYPEKEVYIDDLITWINDSQNIKTTKEQVLEAINEIERLNRENLHKDIQPITDDIFHNRQNKEKNFKIPSLLQNSSKHLGIVIGGFIIALFSITILINNYKVEKAERVKAEEIIEEEIEKDTKEVNELPEELQYKEIEVEKLREWLNQRGSKLADEPYLSTIINVAEEFDMNPILLIAITGQEQGFVQRTHEHADKMANNPFNVYGSWIDYNTDISDSARIAARTIVNLSKNRPSDVDPFKWLNRKYAEDENWHKGVSKIFYMLSEVASVVEKNSD